MSITTNQKVLGAFTLIELLVVIAIIAILAAMLLPSLSRSKLQAQGIQCMNNNKELLLAWVMYADDNASKLPPNNQFGVNSAGQKDLGWVDGDLDFTPNNTDNTNTLLLQQSRLGPYAKNVAIYRCPGDPSQAREGKQIFPRVRSVAMNCFVSGNGNGSSYLQSLGGGTTYHIYEKMSDFNNPALIWVILDESCDSIGDAFFGVDMASPLTITDRPASYHVGACGLAFADGHAEIHKWQDAWARLPLENGTYMYNTMVGPHDMPWLKQRTTERK